MIAGPLIGVFKMNPHQHQRSRHSQRRIKTTRAHSPVAVHIGHNPNLTSATMLVDSGASHILVRQEHIHVLKDVVMSAPNIKKSFASLKSAKKGSELSAIGRGLLQIGPFCLQAFIFSDEELEDALLGLGPLTEHGCTAIFTHQSFHLYYKTRIDSIWIKKGKPESMKGPDSTTNTST